MMSDQHPPIAIRDLCRLAWLIPTASMAPVVAIAQTSEPAAVMAPLPSAAQSALDKGLAAARQQDWLVAVRYFGQARDRAPDAPAPLYNLGLAEAQLPGRELRAVAWFDAYLALDPNAANAAAVRQEMSELNIRAVKASTIWPPATLLDCSSGRLRKISAASPMSPAFASRPAIFAQ